MDDNLLEPGSELESMAIRSIRFVPSSINVVGCRMSGGSFVSREQAVFLSDRLGLRVRDSRVVHWDAWMNGLSFDGRHGLENDSRSTWVVRIGEE